MTMYEFRWKFTELGSLGPNSQYSSIGLDCGLAPTRRQAMIRTNDGYINDASVRHSASMS